MALNANHSSFGLTEMVHECKRVYIICVPHGIGGAKSIGLRVGHLGYGTA